jgi:hypothetical protein
MAKQTTKLLLKDYLLFDYDVGNKGSSLGPTKTVSKVKVRERMLESKTHQFEE